MAYCKSRAILLILQPMTGFWHKYKEEYRKLINIGSPIMVTQLSVILLAFSDTIMVGHYNVDSLAAAAFVNSLYLIPNVMLMGLAAGLTPLVGALFSRDEPHEAGRVTRAAFQVNLITSLIFTAVMGGIYFFLGNFGQEEHLLPLIQDYFLVLLMVPVPMALYYVLMQMSNGMEYTSLPMWITVGCIGVNILGNWLLIYGIGPFPELGLLGAGIATVIARLLSLWMMWRCFRRKRRYRNYRDGFIEARNLGEPRRLVWRTSWPIMLQSFFECGLWSVGAIVVGWFGAVELAAYQVVNTISQLGFMIYTSFASAVAIRVAYYTGTKDARGAGIAARAGAHINVVLATLASLVFIFLGPQLINLFVDTGAEAVKGNAVIQVASTLIFPLVVYQYFDALQLTFCNGIRGTSQSRPLFRISFICYMAVGIPLLLLFASVFCGGAVGAYWSFNVALLAACIMSYIIFRRIRLS